MSKVIKYIWCNGMEGGTSGKRKDGFLWEEKVPHGARKDFFF